MRATPFEREFARARILVSKTILISAAGERDSWLQSRQRQNSSPSTSRALSATWSRARFARSALTRRSSPDGAGWEWSDIMLTSSSSCKVRPSRVSIALRVGEGGSPAQLIETFSMISSHLRCSLSRWQARLRSERGCSAGPSDRNRGSNSRPNQLERAE